MTVRRVTDGCIALMKHFIAKLEAMGRYCFDYPEEIISRMQLFDGQFADIIKIESIFTNYADDATVNHLRYRSFGYIVDLWHQLMVRRADARVWENLIVGYDLFEENEEEFEYQILRVLEDSLRMSPITS